MALSSASDDLMALILSMSKSEKRYFQLHARRGLHAGDSVYLLLYDHLVAQGMWSDDGIREAFAGQPFVSQLVVARTRLQSMILEALCEFDGGITHRLDFSRRFDLIDVTFRRKQFSLCRRLVLAALRHAEALELPWEMLRLIEWDMRLLRLEHPMDMSKRLESLHGRYGQLMEMIHTEARMRYIYDAMMQCQPLWVSPGMDGKEVADKLMGDPVMQLPVSGLSFDCKIMRCYIESFYATIHGDEEAYQNSLGQVVKIWQASPIRIRCQEETYFEALAAYADSTVSGGNSGAAVSKSHRLISRSGRIQQHEKCRILYLNLTQSIRMNNWEDAAACIPDIATALNASRVQIAASIRLGLVSNVIVVFYYMERWEEVLAWGDRLGKELHKSESKQFGDLLRVWRCVAWYELGDLGKVERQLGLGKQQDQEDLVVSHFAQLLEAQDARHEQEAQVRLLEVIHQTHGEEMPMPLVMLEVWAISRSRGISIREAEVIRAG